MKKILLISSLLVSASLFFFSGIIYANTKTFKDVNPNAWYYEAVMNMANWGVINGNDDGTFAPERGVNRAELSVMWNSYDKRVNTLINDNTLTVIPNLAAQNYAYAKQLYYLSNGVWNDNILAAYMKLNGLKNPGSSCGLIVTYQNNASSSMDIAIKFSNSAVTEQNKKDLMEDFKKLNTSCESYWN